MSSTHLKWHSNSVWWCFFASNFQHLRPLQGLCDSNCSQNIDHKSALPHAIQSEVKSRFLPSVRRAALNMIMLASVFKCNIQTMQTQYITLANRCILYGWVFQLIKFWLEVGCIKCLFTLSLSPSVRILLRCARSWQSKMPRQLALASSRRPRFSDQIFALTLALSLSLFPSFPHKNVTTCCHLCNAEKPPFPNRQFYPERSGSLWLEAKGC